MLPRSSSPLISFRHHVLAILTGPPAIAFVPAIALGAFWIGGETALLVVALGAPLLFAACGGFASSPSSPVLHKDNATGLMLRDGFDAALAQAHRETAGSGLRSSCFLLQLDDFHDLTHHHGQDTADSVAQRCAERLTSTLRKGDTVARISESRIAVCLMPVRQLDLELCIQLAGRMQGAVEEPVILDGMILYVSCSVGFCQRNRATGTTPADWFNAATDALSEAEQNGPSAIRAYSPEMRNRTEKRNELREEAAQALENGQIRPWFQPQISTDTGNVTGFEALARWNHPDFGVIGPDMFLPAIDSAGLINRLGQVMLYHALTAIKAWDKAGVKVPCVGVNFATGELRDPALVDRIAWELDRFDLSPGRLSVEILETVVADRPDDVIVRNIAGLSALGCQIDLDDFGTGQASIAAIRRFGVSRIKIDRSFVMKADRDPEQQRMIGAILTMAERLEVQTLAEGVETVGEHALLAQLGCDHVQGFGIGRPMPFEETLDWIAMHRAKLQDAPQIGRQTG